MKSDKKKPAESASKTWFDAAANLLSRRERLWSILLTALGFVLAFLLFDAKLSTGGDDSTYLLQARDLLSTGKLPLGFRVPGYPIVLALFVALAPASVIVSKFSSLLFFVAAVASFYAVFRKRLNPVFLFGGMAAFALSTLELEYAHQTYSEMLYLLVELWALHFFLKSEEPGERRWQYLGLAVLTATAAFYVRVAGISLLVAMGIVWLLKREWKVVGVAVALSVLLYLPLKIAERSAGAESMTQANLLLLKNPYTPALGNETAGGLAGRMWDNFLVHTQYMFPRAVGLPYSDELAQADGRILPTGGAFAAVFVSGIVALGIARLLRERESGMRVMGIAIIAYLLLIFFLLHTVFATIRMMVPLVPLLLIAFFFGAQALFERFFRKSPRSAERTKQWTGVTIVAVLFSNGAFVIADVNRNIPVLQENLKGNEFYGYSADWANYLAACKWVRANLPADSVGVICRKPEMFQIYAGNLRVHGVYQVESTDPDTIVAHWKQWNMTHILYDNFQWSATLRRYVQPVGQKYPQLFELVHQEGDAAPTFVYRLNYAAVLSK